MPKSRPRKSAPAATVWSDTPWINRRPADEKQGREKESVDLPGRVQRQATPAGGPQAPGRTDEDLDCVHRSLSMLTFTQCTKDGSEFIGPCALVCQENGSVAGYFFDSVSRSSWVVCGQVMLHPVDCQQDPDWRLLIVRLQCSKDGQSICTLVEKHGGDAFQLSSPEKSTLEILHLLSDVKVKAETLMQLNFETHTLKGRSSQASVCAQFGSQISQAAVWARNLKVHESSVVNLGKCTMKAPNPVA